MTLRAHRSPFALALPALLAAAGCGGGGGGSGGGGTGLDDDSGGIERQELMDVQAFVPQAPEKWTPIFRQLDK